MTEPAQPPPRRSRWWGFRRPESIDDLLPGGPPVRRRFRRLELITRLIENFWP